MLPKKVAEKRPKTPQQALASLMRLAARTEKTESDALRLLHGWGVATDEAERILAKLIQDRFIDNSRYAEAYVREKTRLSGWGEYKIRAALQRKAISRDIIDRALSQTDDAMLQKRLSALLAKKRKNIKATTAYELKTKLIRYGISLGYKYDQVIEAVQEYDPACDLDVFEW